MNIIDLGNGMERREYDLNEENNFEKDSKLSGFEYRAISRTTDRKQPEGYGFEKILGHFTKKYLIIRQNK